MVSEDYVRLGLRLDKHIHGLVDAYYGTKDLQEAIEKEEIVPLPTLRQQAVDLIQRLPSEVTDPDRQVFLAKQLQALVAQMDRLAGNITDFREYVRLLFDIDPAPADETELEGYRQSVAGLLNSIGYTGDLRDAILRWEEAQYLSDKPLLEFINAIVNESRQKTSRIIDLPSDEKVSIEGVKGQPWSGYNWYKGNYTSLIQVNLDIPRTRIEAEDLATHEAYPGHHTDHAVKEKLFYHGLGYLEASIALINTPSCVLSEGIASAAGLFIATDEKNTDREAATLLRKLRRGCDVNATLMLHSEGIGKEKCIVYLEANGLMTRQRAEKRLDFLTHPLWSPYSYTYWVGGRLVEEFYTRAKKVGKVNQALSTLYYQQLTPTGLQQRMVEL